MSFLVEFLSKNEEKTSGRCQLLKNGRVKWIFMIFYDFSLGTQSLSNIIV